MIVSMNTVATVPRLLRGGLLALAMGVLPFGIANAQDFDAIERRLGAAVSDGEINLSQAQAMMHALRATSDDNDLEKLKAGIERRLRHFGEDLRKRFAAEEITLEEMETRYKDAKREMWGHYREAELKHHHSERKRSERKRSDDNQLDELRTGIEQRLRQHGEKLRRQFAAGEITQEKMESQYESAKREMWGHYRKAELQRHRGEGEHGEAHDHDASQEARMNRIREIEEAMESGKISREEGTRALEETKRGMDKTTRDRKEESSAPPREDDARRSMKTKGVEPRFVPEEEYNRLQAKLKKQIAAGEISEEAASQELVKLQNANNMAHIEKSVREGEATRAEADSLYKKLGIK